jgi:hypothetical protein
MSIEVDQTRLNLSQQRLPTHIRIAEHQPAYDPRRIGPAQEPRAVRNIAVVLLVPLDKIQISMVDELSRLKLNHPPEKK